MIFSRTRFFGLLTALVLLAMPQVRAEPLEKQEFIPQPVREALICNNIEVFERAIATAIEGDMGDAVEVLGVAARVGDCTTIPAWEEILFFPLAVARYYEEGAEGGEEIIMEGITPYDTENSVYLWVDLEVLQVFVDGPVIEVQGI